MQIPLNGSDRGSSEGPRKRRTHFDHHKFGTSGLVPAFTKDEFTTHCLDVVHVKSGVERHLWNGVIEDHQLFYSRLALNQREVHQETFAETCAHQPKWRRTNHWVPLTNTLMCPPPVPVSVGMPPGTSTGAVVNVGECETSRGKEEQERLKENGLLVEIMKGAGEHSKLWKGMELLDRGTFEEYLWQAYSASTLQRHQATSPSMDVMAPHQLP